MDDLQLEPGLPLAVYEYDDLEATRWQPEFASVVVDLLFKCALNRPAEPAALEAYTTALVSGTHTPDKVVSELRNSDEARRLRLQELERYLADAIYPAVLGRDPGENEATIFRKNLERESLKTSFSALLLSPEALRHQLKMITQRFGIAAILLSQADADGELKTKMKTSV